MRGPVETTHDGLLSHDKRDIALVRPLYERLIRDQCGGRALTVWLDDEEIEGGSVVIALNRGLEHSRHVVICMTPNYFASRKGWTDAEWMSAIYDDPAGRLDRVIPVLLADANVPALLRHLDTIDLRDPTRARRPFEVEYRRLVRRLCAQGRVAASGAAIESTTTIERLVSVPSADVIDEVLVTTLLPALVTPETIVVSAITPRLNGGTRDLPSFPREDALLDIVRETKHLAGDTRRFIPSLRRVGDRIVSFVSPRDRLLASVADLRNYEHEPLVRWLGHPDQRRVVVGLMNAAVRDHAATLGLVRHPRHPGRFFYERPVDGSDKRIRWRGKGTPLTVVQGLRRRDGSLRFWMHRAVDAVIEIIDGRPYLQLHPTVVFTWNGTVGRWMGGSAVSDYARAYVSRERNVHLHRHLLYWISVLGCGTEAIQLPIGEQRLVFDARPAQIRLPVGIAHDQVKITGADLQEAVMADGETDEVPDLIDETDLDRLAESVREHEHAEADQPVDDADQARLRWERP